MNNPQDLNCYSYVTNNPLGYTDPTGHWGVSLGYKFSSATGGSGFTWGADVGGISLDMIYNMGKALMDQSNQNDQTVELPTADDNGTNPPFAENYDEGSGISSEEYPSFYDNLPTIYGDVVPAGNNGSNTPTVSQNMKKDKEAVLHIYMVDMEEGFQKGGFSGNLQVARGLVGYTLSDFAIPGSLGEGALIIISPGIGKYAGKGIGYLASKSSKVASVVRVLATDVGDLFSNGAGKRVIYLPANPGPLKQSVAETFNGATYTEVTLPKDTVFYRVYGGEAGKVGRYMTRIPQNGGIQSQFDLALNPDWGNTARYVTKVIVPKGTIIYEGIAAPQTINGGAGQLIGGGNQVYIPEVNLSWYGN